MSAGYDGKTIVWDVSFGSLSVFRLKPFYFSLFHEDFCLYDVI